jgi:hypothetical protein
MNRRVRSDQRPLLPLGLIVVGLLALCGAVAYPFQQLFRGLSPASLRSSALVLPAEVGVVSVCLVLLAVVTTVYGVLLLFLRL